MTSKFHLNKLVRYWSAKIGARELVPRLKPPACVFLRRLGKVCVHRAVTTHFHRSTPRVSPSNTAQPVPLLPPTPPLPHKPIAYVTALARASASFCNPTT